MCCSDGDCLSVVGTYLPGPVLHGCRLFKLCRNLPARHCVQVCRLFKWCRNLPAGHGVAGVQAAEAMLEPTRGALCCRGSGCLSGIGTYLHGTVLQKCRLFKWCLNLPAGPCGAGVQAVLTMSEPTCWALCCRDAGCLSGVGTNLAGTFLQECRTV